MVTSTARPQPWNWPRSLEWQLNSLLITSSCLISLPRKGPCSDLRAFTSHILHGADISTNPECSTWNVSGIQIRSRLKEANEKGYR
jgi:hypothetical protein